MKLQNYWSLILALLMVAGCSHPPIQTAPWYHQISGSISEINRDDYRIVVNSPDEETGITRIFQLKPDNSTRYRNAAGFRDLRAEDSVTVDFTQNQKGEFVPTNIIVTRKKIEEPEEKPKKHGLLE